MRRECPVCGSNVPKNPGTGAQRIYCSELCADAAWRMKRTNKKRCHECGHLLDKKDGVHAVIAAFERRTRGIQ